jgi:type IV pilus assembly protein PilV
MAAERIRQRRDARGVALLEVLIALLIFMVGILGIVGLQAKAIQFSVQAEDRSRAALLANDLVTAMWEQKSATPSDETLGAWKSRIAAALPEGSGEVKAADDGVVSIKIEWRPPGAIRDQDNEAKPNRYETKVTLR